MIVLINNNPALERFAPTGLVGRLVSPRSGHVVRPGEPWAADNDAFLAWDESRFRRMLGRLVGVPGCLFVAAPDVVGDASATLDRFAPWRAELAAAGFPVALVGQDGAESLDLPWGDFEAFFVGGTTDWKLSAAAAGLAAEAKRRGKWVHVGRVNSRRRLRIAYDIGADSVDGNCWSMYTEKRLKLALPFVAGLKRQPLLF